MIENRTLKDVMTEKKANTDKSSDLATKNISFSELGSTGLNRWGSEVYEEFLPNLRWPRAAKIFKEMSSNDPVITAILLTSRQLIKSVTWSVEEASSSQVDLEAADFLRSCLDDMSHTWSDLIDNIITYFEYGWAYHEIVYKRRLGDSRNSTQKSKYDDGRIGWRKLAPRAQESWDGWEFDEGDDGSLKGMYQKKGTTKILIPIEKALLFRTTAARGNPEGKSFLRGAYRPWYFKKYIEEIEGIGIERDLAGLPVVYTPEDVDIWDTTNELARRARMAAETLVKSIRRDKNEGVVLPAGWKLELLGSSSKRQFDTNAVINRYDQRIAITLLSDIVMLGADKVGSFALANVKKSLLAASLDAQVQGILDVFNRFAIPRLFAVNAFPGITDYPMLQASPVDAVDLDVLSNYIQKLSGASMPLFPDIELENYLRSVAHLPPVDPNSESRKMVEKKDESDDGDEGENKDPVDPSDNKNSGEEE